MAVSQGNKNRRSQFRDVESSAPQDFDPEDNQPEFSDSDGTGSEDGRIASGREHYAQTGKSKLRRRELATLGPQYTGSRISRNKLLDDVEEHDPFAEYRSDEESVEEAANGGSDVDEEIGSSGSEGFESEDEENFDMDGDDGTGTDETSVDGEDRDEEDEEEDDDVFDAMDRDGANNVTDREQLKQILNQDRGNVAATIAQANKADAEKGEAVKKQRQTFDAVLNGRIRLQQALVAINSLADMTSTTLAQDDHAEAIKGAEKAAIKLWNTIESLKDSIASAHAGTKRKRHDLTPETLLSDCWTWMRDYEAPTRAHRRSVLQKWSAKTQAATVQPTTRKLIASDARQSTILNVLDEQMSNKPRLIARTQIPRSCAPVQAASGTTESPTIFDDADFYGMLLKELLERKAIDAGGAGASALAISQLRAERDARVKKKVGTKASKGRKLRYTVQERLQNFMAPEDRRTWSERQIDELFGSLLGRKMVLEEGRGVETEGADDGMEEEALVLFRS